MSCPNPAVPSDLWAQPCSASTRSCPCRKLHLRVTAIPSFSSSPWIRGAPRADSLRTSCGSTYGRLVGTVGVAQNDLYCSETAGSSQPALSGFSCATCDHNVRVVNDLAILHFLEFESLPQATYAVAATALPSCRSPSPNRLQNLAGSRANRAVDRGIERGPD
jgi:hypothetical protein